MIEVLCGVDLFGNNFTIRFYAHEYRKVFKMLKRWYQAGHIKYLEDVYTVYECCLIFAFEQVEKNMVDIERAYHLCCELQQELGKCHAS